MVQNNEVARLAALVDEATQPVPTAGGQWTATPDSPGFWGIECEDEEAPGGKYLMVKLVSGSKERGLVTASDDGNVWIPITHWDDCKWYKLKMPWESRLTGDAPQVPQ
jgi:hypothetical protein